MNPCDSQPVISDPISANDNKSKRSKDFLPTTARIMNIINEDKVRGKIEIHMFDIICTLDSRSRLGITTAIKNNAGNNIGTKKAKSFPGFEIARFDKTITPTSPISNKNGLSRDLSSSKS
jgi:hypothetical protein